MSVSPPPAPSASRPTGFLPGIRRLLGVGSLLDWVFRTVCQACAGLVIVLVFLIVILLYQQARPAIAALGPAIFTSSVWAPNAEPPELGGLAFVYGSVVTSLLAMLLAVPLGVGTAAYLSELASAPVKRVGSFLVEMLAAIPSVVYGFWGISALAPLVQAGFDLLGGPNIGGRGLVTASLILAVMVVPYIAAVAYDVCQAVPRTQREASLAVGATRWQTIWKVVLPYARPGIVGGCFLALGRAIGETIAVTLLIGNVTGVQMLPFGQGSTIPSIVAAELPGSNVELHASALIELGLLLFGVTVVMNALARLLIWRVGATRSGPGLVARLFRARPRPAPAGETPPSAGERPPRVPARLPANPGAQVVDRLMSGVLFLSLVVTCGPLFLILGYITVKGVGAFGSFQAVVEFFTALPKPQGEEGGGLANALVGSCIIVGLATLFALPVGLAGAIFLAEYRTSRLVPVVRFFGELLNGVPSIVIGTFVAALVRLLIQTDFLGPKGQFSGWAGAFALGVMMVPIVLRASEEALKLVPEALRNASHALGAHQWQTVVRITVPAALPAIITGTFLAIARIAGETAPLLLTIFGTDRMRVNPADPMPALPLYIYYYAQSGNAIFEQKAWAAALVLLAFVMVLNVGIRVLTGNRVLLASRAE